MDIEKATEKTIDALNGFLRGEIAAVETYGQALEKLSATQAGQQLTECKRSHEQRVQLLRQEILRLGGRPSSTSGPWGGFAKLVEGSAKGLGDKATLAALEEGEDIGVRQYRRDIDELESETRALIERSILPQQERTHASMSTLKRTFH